MLFRSILIHQWAGEPLQQVSRSGEVEMKRWGRTRRLMYENSRMLRGVEGHSRQQLVWMRTRTPVLSSLPSRAPLLCPWRPVARLERTERNSRREAESLREWGDIYRFHRPPTIISRADDAERDHALVLMGVNCCGAAKLRAQRGTTTRQSFCRPGGRGGRFDGWRTVEAVDIPPFSQ